ncbi:MAG: fatty acyl-AMP ligase [Bacteroidia bacterium]
MNPIPMSLVDILQKRAESQSQKLAYRFLTDGEEVEVDLTYEQLDRRARSIGALLQANTEAGDRVLLLLPAGLDFIAAYFGCLYAKLIAIPVPPPHPARLAKTLATSLRIASDAKPTVALVSNSLFKAIATKADISNQFRKMKLLVADKNEIGNWADKWQKPIIKESDIAFLQYTSGSTSTPKGVMLSHGNLLHNLELIEKSFGQSNKSETVIWLPPYHDMGLIGGILQPLYTGNTVSLIPHLLFLQRPIRWLKAISRFKATTSGGPNFAYELCVKKIKPEQREQLDLSHWEVAFNGAEPIFHKTLDQFADYFAPCGFRPEAFSPCYGLAEATLMVVGTPKNQEPIRKNLLKSGIEENKTIFAPDESAETQTVISSGKNIAGQDIRIVDVETLCPSMPGQIGEIWLRGPSIAKAYWNKPKATASTFEAYLADSKEGPFLRTGDLGFIEEGELFVTGRLKNLIIIDGKNHYPHDLERTILQSHSAIRPLGCAVFSVEESGRERVIVIAEIQHTRGVNAPEIIMAIRKAVSENHELHVYDVKLSLAGSIPRTTSGKIKHFLCKENYLSKTLKEITLT